tara:strand:+ start:6453 stop:12347 length:5895 start_codon:yes stop_codon:yes gene_type:complete
MADNEDGFKLVSSAFRRKVGTSIVDQREGGFRHMGDVGDSERLLQKQIQYLQKQLQVQKGLEPVTGSTMDATKAQARGAKELFTAGFKQAWGTFSLEDQGRLRGILAGGQSASVRQQAYTNKILDTEMLPSHKWNLGRDGSMPASGITEILEKTLSGGAGGIANNSNLLLKLISAQQQAMGPLARETVANEGRVPQLRTVAEELNRIGFNAYMKHIPVEQVATTKGFVSLPSNMSSQQRAAMESYGYSPEEVHQTNKRFIPSMDNKARNELARLVNNGDFQVALTETQHETDQRISALRGEIKYQDTTLQFRLPKLTKTKTKLGHDKWIGFSGDTQSVRRMYLPYEVIERQGDYANSVFMTADEFYLKTINEEIMPALKEGKMTGEQARQAFKDARQILTDAELPLGSSFTMSPAQSSFEAVRSAASIIVERTPGSRVEATGVRPAYQRLNATGVARFIEANAIGRPDRVYTADTGKLGQGVVSRVDLAGTHVTPDELVEHAGLHQAVRKPTPAKEAILEAYDEFSGSKITDLEERQDFIRQFFIENNYMHGDEMAILEQQKNGFTKRQALRAEAIARVHQQTSAPGIWNNVSSQDVETLVSIASNKGISIGEMKGMVRNAHAYDKLNEAGLAHPAKHFAKKILDAPFRMSSSSVRRMALSASTPMEKALSGFSDRLGEVRHGMGQKEFLQSRKQQNDVVNLMKQIKKGDTPWRDIQADQENFNYAFRIFQKEGTGNQYATKFLEEYQSLYRTPKGVAAAEGLNRQVMELLSEHEGVINVGAYYIDEDKVGDIGKVPFGSGGAIHAPSMKKLTTVEVADQMKLATVQEGLFKQQGDKLIFDTDVFKNRKEIFLGYDASGSARSVTKDMVDKGEFRFMEARLVGNRDSPLIHLDFIRKLTPEELVKLHGDIKTGAPTLDSNRAYRNVADEIGSTVQSAQGKRVLKEQRMQSDLMTFSDSFKKGKKRQQHNRQMLTAMGQHSLHHLQAWSTSGLASNNGSYLGKVFQETTRITKDMYRFNQEVYGSAAFGGGDEAARRRFDLRTGAATFDPGLGDTQPRWKATGTWGHRKGTQALMEHFFTTGINLSLQAGMSEAGKMPHALADRSLRYLDADYFSEIFGLVGTHFGDEEAEAMVTEVLGKSITKSGHSDTISNQLGKLGFNVQEFISGSKTGVAAGLIRLQYGDAMSQQGAGKMATFEPRLLNILQNPTFGEHSGEITEDILKRMRWFDASPQGQGKYGVHQETEKMLASMVGLKAPVPGESEVYKPDLKVTDVSEIMEDVKRLGGIAEKEGREFFLQMGDDAPVYLPPETMQGMASETRETLTGQKITTQAQLKQHIRGYVTQHIAGSNDAERQQAMKALKVAIGEEWGSTGKGMGAWTRNRIPGSQFLTASRDPVTHAGTEQLDNLFENVISAKTAGRMVDQMKETGLYDDNDIDLMFEKMMKGEAVSGIVFRHPGIGPYSIQKTSFRVAGEMKTEIEEIDGKKRKVKKFVPNYKVQDSTIYMPENRVDLDLDILSESTDNLNQGVRQRVSAKVLLGPMVGMAGDYDFDITGAMLLDPKLEKKVSSELSGDSKYLKGYVEHQIRFQLLKEQAGHTGDDTISAMSAGGDNIRDSVKAHVLQARKLGIQQESIGTISSLITRTKMAALSNLQDEEIGSMMTLLEWIEQKPIGFKHVKSPEELQSKLTSLIAGFESGDRTQLSRGIGAFLEAEASLLENQSITMTDESRAALKKKTGLDISAELPKIDIERTISLMAHSIQKGHKDGLFREINAQKGKGGANNIEREVRRLIQEEAAGPQSAAGKFADNVEQAASNFMGAAGKQTILHHRGIQALAAIGGLAALSGMNSQPKEMVGPGKQFNANVQTNMNNSRKAHKRMNPRDVKPMKAPIGNPTGPNMLSQRRAMIASHPAPTNQFLVRARASHPEDIAVVSQQMKRYSMAGGSVNMASSSRSIQNPYANMNTSY